MTVDFPLPPNLPEPVDDGAADHLRGIEMPDLQLQSPADRLVDLSRLGKSRTVICCYPMTGIPGTALPEGWDAIPGARRCTPQTCGFRHHHKELTSLNARVFGLSTQSTEYQFEMATRLKLPFEILSDARYELCDALRLPTFSVEETRLVKRITLIVLDDRIEHVFYPVFPPDSSVELWQGNR